MEWFKSISMWFGMVAIGVFAAAMVSAVLYGMAYRAFRNCCDVIAILDLIYIYQKRGRKAAEAALIDNVRTTRESQQQDRIARASHLVAELNALIGEIAIPVIDGGEKTVTLGDAIEQAYNDANTFEENDGVANIKGEATHLGAPHTVNAPDITPITVNLNGIARSIKPGSYCYYDLWWEFKDTGENMFIEFRKIGELAWRSAESQHRIIVEEGIEFSKTRYGVLSKADKRNAPRAVVTMRGLEYELLGVRMSYRQLVENVFELDEKESKLLYRLNDVDAWHTLANDERIDIVDKMQFTTQAT